MICKYCNEEVNQYYIKSTEICQSCYNYYRDGGRIHGGTKKGTLSLTEDGNPICHICGQAHINLSNHIVLKHKMRVEDYKEKYKLPQNLSLTSEAFRNTMREHNTKNYEVVVTKNLLEHGKATRFRPGVIHNNKYSKKLLPVSLAHADTK